MVPNVPLIAATYQMHDKNIFVRAGFNTFVTFSGSKEFHTLSVQDYLFGYTDNFIGGVQKFKPDFNSERVGMLAGRKGVSIDNFTVYTGEDSLENLGRIHAMNGLTNVTNWSTDECNEISGSDGSQFQPHTVDREQDLNIFIKSFCRKIPLEYEEEVTVLNGIPAWRYASKKGSFDSPRTNPDNACYCDQDEEHYDKCPVDGIFDASSCADGIPLMISYPHFLEGNESLLEPFEGLKPQAELHRTFADIHERLAFPIAGSSRFQVNVLVKSMDSLYNKLPKDLILPICWIEITSGDIPANLKSVIFNTTHSANASYFLIQFGSLIAATVSLLLLISTTFFYCMRLAGKSSGRPIRNSDNIVVTVRMQSDD